MTSTIRGLASHSLSHALLPRAPAALVGLTLLVLWLTAGLSLIDIALFALRTAVGVLLPGSC